VSSNDESITSLNRLTNLLANAEALYARTNLLVVTESVRLDSAPNFVHVVAMVITQEKIAVGNDHIVKIKIKGRPGETRFVLSYVLLLQRLLIMNNREAALSFLLAHLENGIHNLLWSTPTEEPQRYQYNPAT